MVTYTSAGLKYKSLMGKRKLRDKKNSIEILKSSFADLAAEEVRKIIQRQDLERNGDIYQKDEARPAEGAFEIVPEANTAVMLDALVQNGLVRFEDNTPVDFSVKDFKILEGEYIDEAPTSSELLLQLPKKKRGKANVLFRTVLLDARFVDKTGKPLYKKISETYAKAVLNNLNPLALFLAYGKELPELLKRAGDQAQGFEK